MKKELDEALVRDFPLLFADRRASVRQSCMGFGFEVGDGWEPLIRQTAEKLEPLIQKFIDENPNPGCSHCGNPKVEHSALDPEYRPSYPCAAQVKEKYGELCLYMTSATSEMWDVIQASENLSATICEECGGKGELRKKGWWLTLCDACEEKRQKRFASV